MEGGIARGTGRREPGCPGLCRACLHIDEHVVVCYVSCNGRADIAPCNGLSLDFGLEVIVGVLVTGVDCVPTQAACRLCCCVVMAARKECAQKRGHSSYGKGQAGCLQLHRVGNHLEAAQQTVGRPPTVISPPCETVCLPAASLCPSKVPCPGLGIVECVHCIAVRCMRQSLGAARAFSSGPPCLSSTATAQTLNPQPLNPLKWAAGFPLDRARSSLKLTNPCCPHSYPDLKTAAPVHRLHFTGYQISVFLVDR